MCSWVAVGEAGMARNSNSVRPVERHYLQENQPPGVPPLPLTGERTLPDVPAENYWFRRHLVVYEWIARRTGGMRVVDMACGEGYGSHVLAAAGGGAGGGGAHPGGPEHAPPPP